MSLQTTIVRRGRRYYFRLRVPQDLTDEIKRKELRLSLRTSRPDEARRLGSRLLARAHELFRTLRDPVLSHAEKERLARRLYQILLDQDESARIKCNGLRYGQRLLDNTFAARDEWEQIYRTALARGDYKFIEPDILRSFAQRLGVEEGVEDLVNDQEFRQFVLRTMIELTRALRARDEGRYYYEPADPLLREPSALAESPVGGQGGIPPPRPPCEDHR